MKKLFTFLCLMMLTMSVWANDILVTLPDGVTPQKWTIEGTIMTNTAFYSVQREIQMAFDGNDVYLQGLDYNIPESWIKGTYNPSKGRISFPSGQFVGRYKNSNEYLIGSPDGDEIIDIIFNYEPEVPMMKLFKYVFISYYSSYIYYDAYWYDVICYQGEPIKTEPVKVPDNLVADPYMLTAMYTKSGNDEWLNHSFQTQICFDGNDVYFQGFSPETSEFWAKGTLSDDGKTVIIPANQYLGSTIFGPRTYDYFITAADAEGKFADIVLNYDAATGTFTTDQLIYINLSKLKIDYDLRLSNVVITKMTDYAATPADPVVMRICASIYFPYIYINVPVKDTKGRLILADKLYYIIWYEKDGIAHQFKFTKTDYEYLPSDLTEIPYNYNDNNDFFKDNETTMVYINGFNEDIKTTWTKIGIQSVYYGGGECHTSNIVWTHNNDVSSNQEINCESGSAQDYLHTCSSKNINVTLVRNLRVNQFNTLVLPFSMTSGEVENVFGEETKVYLFDSFDPSTNIIQMVSASGDNPITANKPCIIVPTNAMPSDGYSIADRTLEPCSSPNPSYAGSDGSVKSIGNYSASYLVHPASGNPKVNWVLGYKNNEPAMYYVDQDDAIYLRPTQAYFEIPEATNAKALNFSVDGDATGIVTMDEGGMNFITGKIYDLSGREVTNPGRGIYIINGKKVLR